MTDLPIFPLTDEHKMLRDAARDFAQKEIAPVAAEHDESGEFPHATIKKMGGLGFMGIEVPEQYGGVGTRQSGAVGSGTSPGLNPGPSSETQIESASF